MNADDKKPGRAAALSDARKALLQKRLRAAGGKPKAPAIPRRDPDAAIPASAAQERLFFLDRLEPGCSAYHMSTALRLRGALDVAALESALNSVARRHESLRTCFELKGDNLVQKVAARLTIRLPVTGPDPADSEQHLHRRLVALANRPFDLIRGPLLRADLLQCAPDEHILLITAHHTISDEWSVGLLLRELGSVYDAHTGNATGDLAELTIQYGDFAAWQAAHVAARRESQLEFWRNELDGAEPDLALPYDFRRPAARSHRGALCQREFDATLVEALEKLARRAGATPFMTLLAAFQVLMHRYTGQTDLLIGTPTANRNLPETESLIGLFLNTLVIRARLAAEDSFVSILERVRDTAAAAYAHQDLPFETLVAELKPQRDLSTNPFFQVMLVMETDPLPGAGFRGLNVTRLELDTGTAKFDLTVFVRPGADRLVVSAEYDTDLFEPATITQLLDSFETLLDDIARRPQAAVRDLTVISADARDRLAALAHGPAPVAATDGDILHRFRRCRDMARNSPAVISPQQTLGYDELDRRAAELARHLVQRGIGQGDIVPVLCDRCADQVVALLAVLMTGAAYTPLDPAYPRARHQAVLEDLRRREQGLVCAVTSASCAATMDDSGVATAVVGAARGDAGIELPESVSPDDLAYVIYTSGSTGKPKGVGVTHGNLAASNGARLDFYGSPVGRYLLVSSVAFDSSVAGIYWTLTTGGALVLPPSDGAADPRILAALVEREQVTHTLMLPALYELLMEAAGSGQLASLTTVIVAGEACNRDLPRRHAVRLPDATLFNEYGPTEATVWSTVHTCSGQESERVPIGRPVAGTEAWILDANRQLAPPGALGELYVGGANLTAGYLGQPALTDAVFVPHVFVPGRFLYKTGDRVRLDVRGEIEFHGRLDDQIKVRGFRVEVGEIEAVLLAHPGVHDVAVAAVSAAADKPQRLVAYVSGDPQTLADPGEIGDFLRDKLPSYMVPNAVEVLDALPRTPSGKLDRARLPETDRPAPRRRTEFNDDLERDLAAIWQRLLDTDSVRPEDDFFDLGGHSLLGVSLMLEMERRFGVSLPLASLFRSPRLDRLAAEVRDARQAQVNEVLIAIRPDGALPPVFCIHGGARALAADLEADRPVYLLFQRIADLDPEINSVERMASQYLAEIRRVQPTGPYHLVGFSVGAQIAYEIAIRLQGSGESVSLLGLCDPPPPETMTYYRQRLALGLRDILQAPTLAGRGLQAVRYGAGLVQRRIKRLWLRGLAAYFDRTRAAAGTLRNVALAIAGLGILTWAAGGIAMNWPQWRVVSQPLSSDSGEPLQVRFTAHASGRLEIELEVDRTLPEATIRSTVLALSDKAPLPLEWAVSRSGEQVAGGDASDYSYLEMGPRSLAGKLRRIALRIPFGQNTLYFHTFGLAGATTAARGIGAFDSVAGQEYLLEVRSGAAMAILADGRPRLVVRADRRRFEDHLARTGPVSLAGIAIAALGLLLLGVWWLRERQAMPAEVVRFLEQRHYGRIAGRYRYPHYDGSADMLVPESLQAEVEDIRAAWTEIVHGGMTITVIPGTRKHVDMIHGRGGAALAAHFGQVLRDGSRGSDPARHGDPDMPFDRKQE